MNEMNILTLNGEQYEVADKTAREGKADKAYVDKTFAPAIPVTMTGTAVSTDMVSPVEHEVKCRAESINLLSEQPGVVTRFKIIPVKLEPGTYTVSAKSIKTDAEIRLVSVWFKGGNSDVGFVSIEFAKTQKGTFTLEKPAEYAQFVSYYTYAGAPDYVSTWTDVQIQKGSVVTPYVPYVPDITAVTVTQSPGGKTFKPSSDGTVTGMKSIAPSMTITTDNPGANLEVTYNADTKKYIDSKSTNAPNILTVNTTAGATVTATDGITSLKETATNGKAEFTIPETGEWTATAEKDGESSKPVTVDVTDNFTADAPIIPKANIYGAQWDGTASTKWARTDDAVGFTDPVPALNNGTGSSPFDNIMPWAGMTRVSDPVAGELVKIPKFYYKWTKVGNGLKLQISERKPDGTWFTSPAHMDRGDGHGERDVVYVGRYHCGSDYKSTTGVKPKVSITRATARAGIHALGEDIWQWDWHTHMAIWMLYLVEFADWNSQTAIGYGCGNDNFTENMGKSDNMQYHTGTPYSGITTYGVGVQYRNIEGLWDNVFDWIDGCYYTNHILNIINNTSKFSDSENGVPVSSAIPEEEGVPSEFSIGKTDFMQIIYPVKEKGTADTYSCDNWSSYSLKFALYVGGSPYAGQIRGINFIGSRDDRGFDMLGTRLMKLPNA